MLKSDVLIATLGKRVSGGSSVPEEIELLKQSVEVLDIGVKNSQNHPNLKMVEEKLEAAKVFYDYYSKDKTIKNGVTPAPELGVTPFKIVTKPFASYTDNAREAGISGTVKLAVLLGANGKIQNILKLKGVGYGLDEQAFNAARKIEFKPKMKDGKAVSTVAIIEYSFSIKD